MTSPAGRAAHPNAGQVLHTNGGPHSRTSPPDATARYQPVTIAEKVDHANRLAREAAALLPWNDPVGVVQWVHISRIQANEYNPNSVANQEMKLLYTSIDADGYTQPVVAIWDPDAASGDGRYIIVDGFHRWTVMRKYADIRAARSGYLPVVVLDKPPADRMASTIRHNRARGKHSVTGMGALIFGMLNEGQTDEQICNKLGMEPGELSRLKHITGYSKLYANATHSMVAQTKTQIEAKAAYKQDHPDEEIPPW